jgi:hypothetical protein
MIPRQIGPFRMKYDVKLSILNTTFRLRNNMKKTTSYDIVNMYIIDEYTVFYVITSRTGKEKNLTETNKLKKIVVLIDFVRLYTL